MKTISSDLLSQLKDIQQPAAISWWPPAIGWWIIIVLFMVVLLFISRYYWPRWQHRREQQRWRLRLQAYVETASDPKQCHAILIQLSQVLRTLAQQAYPEQAAGQLLGSAWLAFLNKTSDSKVFSGKLANALVVGPYSPTVMLTDVEREQLFSAVTAWVLKHV